MASSSQKYELVFPDGHVIRFADFNEMVNYTACKPFHKPLSFNGRIVDNLASWKIVESPDKTSYRIGVRFEKEMKMIPVEVVHDKFPQLKEQPTFVFPYGTYFPNPGVWKVEGTEIVKLKSPIIIKVSNTKSFAVRSAQYDGEKLYIELSPLFKYDTTEILSNLFQRFNHDVELTLSERKSGKPIAIFKSNLKILYLPYNYNEVALLIPSTEYTMASRAKFSPEGKIYPYEIKDKPFCKIIVKIDANEYPALRSRLSNGKNVGLIEWEIDKDNRRQIKRYRITGSSIEIKALPESNISIHVRLDGYIPISETVANYKDTQIPKIVTVIPKLKLNRRIFLVLKEYIWYIITGIICFVLGLIIGHQTNSNPVKRDVINQSRETTESTNNFDEIPILVDTIVTESENEDVIDDNRTPSKPTVYQRELIRKLEGTGFTRKDVVRAREELHGLGYDDLIADAEACIEIINLKPSERYELKKKGSTVYNQFVRRLNHHKSIMIKIIHSEEYLTSSRRVASIADIVDFIEGRNMKINKSNEDQETNKVYKSIGHYDLN